MNDVIGLRSIPKGLFKEERDDYKMTRIMLQTVTIFSLYAFAENVCNQAQGICKALRDPHNQKRSLRIIDDYTTNRKVMSLCDRIEKNIYEFYNEHGKLLASLQSRTAKDVYESVALTNEAVASVTSSHIRSVSDKINAELAQYRPVDHYLFSAINIALYLSSLFVKYRITFKATLGSNAVVPFRALKLDGYIRELANELHMVSKDGKTLRYLYERCEVKLWSTFAKRRSYKGIDIANTRTIDIRKHFANESIDRTCFELVRSMFRFSNIDIFCAAGNEGRSPDYAHHYNSEYFFGCMYTYEQYSITSCMLSGDIETARRRMRALREMEKDGEFLVCYQDTNGNATFDGIYTSAEQASAESGDNADAIRRSAEYNSSFRPGKQELYKVRCGRAYFKMSLLEDYLDYVLNKKAS